MDDLERMTIFANDLNGEVLKLRKQLVELQSDKAELISQRDTWIGNADALRKQLDEWEEKEAACCPEDFGFEEVIKSLRKQLEVAVEAIDTIINPDSPFASSKYIAREAKAKINRIGGKNE